MSNTQLFPYVLLRIAGGSAGDFQKTDLRKTYVVAAKLHQKEKKVQETREDLVDRLYACIPTTTNSEVRQILIKLKRDAHNRRPITYLTDTMLAQLPEDLQAPLTSYIDFIRDITKLEKEGEHIYETETVRSKDAFAVLLRQPNFQNGLLLSSATIIESLKKYLKSDAAKNPIISKKERSFMEYLSRMCTKPTPFGTFTHLGIASFTRDKLSSLAAPSRAGMIVKSHVQLNNELFRYVSGLLVKHPEVRQHLAVIPNFTIRKEEGEFRFLTNSRNRESFQYIGSTPSLEIIYTLATKKHWTYKAFIQEIVDKKHVAAPEKAVKTYIDRLLDVGFFEYDLGVSGLDRDWASKLAERLSSLTEQLPLLKKLTADLKTLQKLAFQYQEAGVQHRAPLLQQAFKLYKDSCIALGATDAPAITPDEKDKKEEAVFKHTHDIAFTFKPHQLWYEDTAFDHPFILSPELKNNLESLGNLLARMGSLDTCLQKREALAYFFKAMYGTDARVGLLQFYRDYYKQTHEHKKVMNPLTKEREVWRQKVLKSFIKNVKDQLYDDEIQLTEAHIPSLPPPSTHSSFAAFFHLYKDEEGVRVVSNTIVSGHGKMFGRFLYLFPDSVTKELRLWSAKHDDGTVMAEATDASVFNANLHDRIMPYEIRTPGGQTMLPLSSRIDVNELEITYDAKSDRLTLMHAKSHKEVIAFDLGFETPLRRSELYTLLGSFMPGSPHHPIEPLTTAINKYLKKERTEGAPIILPRITYQNQVVLQRKTWLVPKGLLPKRNSDESNWSYFLRLYQWKEQLGLPHEVFIRKGTEKPQYISFRNPFLIALFESISNSVSDELTIEEMLPNSEQLLGVNQEKRVTELLCQWYIT